ncbi:GPW/gp25 family protein [Zooshikella marina]|uniref:GPW/gp25 family protein n=1 Tax=Zooshikella ganghwensis TaxID=202772 RepID=UPI001BB04D0D|nr:GPW/gp25 family protein [Zooshikella ganghwensis]MBU2707539.1 GPW/gp25 family protein [Zooshikella ganghwensis]
MLGMNAKTGELIDGVDHIEQSIRDILTTLIGSRVMRRNYGSRLMSIIDNPTNHYLIANIHSAVIEALSLLEHRIRIRNVQVNNKTENEPGGVDIVIEGTLADTELSFVIKDIYLFSQ